MKSIRKRIEDSLRTEPVKTIEIPCQLLTVKPDQNLPRIAEALERIADVLEKQNAGTDEEFRQRVIAVINQGIPATITRGYINCDEKLTPIKPDGIAIDNEKITSARLFGAK